MRLDADAATHERRAAALAAAQAHLDAHGVSEAQAAWAYSLLEMWDDDDAGPDTPPLEEGARERRIWGEAQSIALDVACPHLKGGGRWRGRLEFGSEAPEVHQDFSRFLGDQEPPF